MSQLYRNASLVYIDLKKFNKANKLALNSLKAKKKFLNKKHPSLLESYVDLARINFKLKHLIKAKLFALMALEINKKIYNNNDPKSEDEYLQTSLIYEMINDFDNAYIYMKKVLNSAIKSKNNIYASLNQKNKYKYVVKNRFYFNRLFRLYNKSKKENPKEIFNLWIQHKGDITSKQNLLSSTKEESIRNKRKELYQIYKEYSNLKLLYVAREENSFLKRDLELLDVNKTKLEQELSHIIWKSNFKIITSQEIANNLAPDELYIDYIKAEGSYHIFTLNSKNEVSFNFFDKDFFNFFTDYYMTSTILSRLGTENYDLLEDKSIKYIAKNYEKSLRDKLFDKLSDVLVRDIQHVKHTAGFLYFLFIENPIEEKVKKYNKLIISKDKILHQLPFEAFFNDSTGKYLIEEKEISYVPSAKEFVRLHNMKKQGSKNDNKIVVFANPNFKMLLTDEREKYRGEEAIKELRHLPSFQALEGFKKEAEMIQETYPEETIAYIGDNASEKNLFQVKSPKILHFATHGFFVNDENLSFSNIKSGIALSGYNTSILNGKSYEGIVTASKLFHLDLSGTELVVFSACDTGVGDIHNAEGVTGLNKAVIQAGASRVLMSLWKVDDTMTVRFMRYFYTYLKAGHNYSQALRETKLRMIREKIDPKHWSAFVLNGID